MSLRKKILLVLAACLLIVLLYLTFLIGSNVSIENEEITFSSPEVQLNPYLAAEHFLKKQDIAFRAIRHFDGALRLPANGQTLFFLASRGEMTQKQSEELLEWTSFGGHLVLVAERKWDEEKGTSGDLLLDNLGIRQYLAKDLPAEEPAAEKKRERYSSLTKLYLENEQSPAYIGFNTGYHLYDSEDRAHAFGSSANDMVHILQLQHGDGLITVITDPWIWYNNKIGEYDNAWLLWYLSQEDSEVTFLHEIKAQTGGLFDALGKHFPEVLCALLLLIMLVLWHKGQRQGALLPAASRARRQLEEHLSASADFMLRHLGRAHLIEKLQQDIEQRGKERQLGFSALEASARLKVLAQISRQNLNLVQQAMHPPAKRLSATDFSRQVKDLQTLRNAL